MSETPPNPALPRTAAGPAGAGLHPRAPWPASPGAAGLGRWRHTRMMNTIASRIFLSLIAAWVWVPAGCSRSASPSASHSPVVTAQRTLSANGAADLAARLANDQCERQYRKRPFRSELYSVKLHGGIYRWGGLDIGGPGGFSALVTFRQDGSDPHAEVYFSTDALKPKR